MDLKKHIKKILKEDDWNWVNDIEPGVELVSGLYAINACDGFDETVVKSKLEQLSNMGLNTSDKYCNWFNNENIQNSYNKCILDFSIDKNGECSFGWMPCGGASYYDGKKHIKLELSEFLNSWYMPTKNLNH